MRIVQMRNGYKNFAPKCDYVMPEDIEDGLRLVAGNAVGNSTELAVDPRSAYTGQDLNGKKLLVWRMGGIGDIFFLTSALHALKMKYPESTIKLATGVPAVTINNPDFETINMPFMLKELVWANYILQFQGVIENNPLAKVHHVIDVHLQRLGLNPDEVKDKKPKLYVSEEEREWATKESDKLGFVSPVVGLQLSTSSVLRDLPKSTIMSLVQRLISKGYHVALVGGVKQVALANEIKQNFDCYDMTSYSIRQSIVMVSKYDIVVGPDSWLIQAAIAFDIPCVGLYGPFPSSLRMGNSRCTGLDIKAVCAPCFLHGTEPCIKGNPSPCMTLHTVDKIIECVEEYKVK